MEKLVSSMYFREREPRRDFHGIKRTREILKRPNWSQNYNRDLVINRKLENKNKSKSSKKRYGFIKSTCNFIYTYFSLSTIHGPYHLTPTDRHWSEYCLWVICIILGIIGCIYISSYSWSRYQNNPTVISIERNWKDWNTTLSSVTVCPYNRINEESILAWSETVDSSEDKQKLAEFVTNIAEATYDSLSVVKYDVPSVKPENYTEIIYQNRFYFSYFSSSNNPLIKKDHLGLPVPSFTEIGICYALNSAISYSLSPPYFFEDINTLPPKEPLDLVHGTIDADLVMLASDLNSGHEAYINGPYEIPDIASKYLPARYGTFADFVLLTLEIYSSEDLKHLSIHQRKCRFLDESDLSISKVYSYNLCRMECRMKLAEELCGCTPHFYRKLEGKKICDFNGIQCLKNNSDFLIKLRHHGKKEKVHCSCLPLCDDINYIIDYQSVKPWYTTSLRWQIIKFPKIRLKRDIIFSFSDLLVSIGGTAGLFLGCSVLSFIEILYFFSLRLIIYVCGRFSWR